MYSCGVSDVASEVFAHVGFLAVRVALALQVLGEPPTALFEDEQVAFYLVVADKEAHPVARYLETVESVVVAQVAVESYVQSDGLASLDITPAARAREGYLLTTRGPTTR